MQSTSSPPPGEVSVGKEVFKGWMATVLCGVSLLAGPSVCFNSIEDGIGVSAGSTPYGSSRLKLPVRVEMALRPPVASALSEEKVQYA